jgi:hypothetical protein
MAVALVLIFAVPGDGAVQPSVGTIERLPVQNGGTIILNIEQGPIAQGAITLLTVGDPPNGRPVDPSTIRIAPGRPASVVFRNFTPHKLRVTLQQPKTPSDVKKEEKPNFCTPTCELDPILYTAPLPGNAVDTELCTPDSTNPSLCHPNIGVLAICGSPQCEAIRKACKGHGCLVDLYRALDTCGCSVPRTLLPSTAGETPALQGSVFNEGPLGEIILWTPARLQGLLTDFERTRAAAMVGKDKADLVFSTVENSAVPVVPDVPSVLFDAALFTGKDGLSVEKIQYRFLIEQDPPPTPPAPVPPSTFGQVAMVWTVDPAPTLVPGPGGPSMRVVVVPLDDTGVASWRYLNPRNPACINCGPGGVPLATTDAPAGVAFHNRTLDRTFAVSLTLPATASISAADEASFKCTAGQPCKISRSAPAQTTVVFDSAILSLFVRSVIKFDVSVVGETVTLGNPAAYLSLEAAVDAAGKSTLLDRASGASIKTVKVSLAGRVDPDIPAVPKEVPVEPPPDDPLAFKPCTPRLGYKPDNEPLICTEHPYADGSIQQYRASGSVQLIGNISDRADAAITLGFREGTLGADIDKTGLSDYQVSIYGINGLSLKFGKTDFAIPSSGIAVAESGEGFLYTWRFLSLGHVMRRESTAGTPERTNRDKKDWFAQARSLPIGQRWRETMRERSQARAENRDTRALPEINRFYRALSIFRSADLIAVRGEDKNLESVYETFGGEVFFARPASSTLSKGAETTLFNIFGGSLAAYQSRRNFAADAACRTAANPLIPCRNGRGHVWLLTLNWTPSIVIAGGSGTSTTPHNFSFALGAGTGIVPPPRIATRAISVSRRRSPRTGCFSRRSFRS